MLELTQYEQSQQSPIGSHPLFEVNIDTFSFTGPADALFPKSTEDTALTIMQTIEQASVRTGEQIAVYESAQHGTLGTAHPNILPTGSIDLPRVGIGKDAWEAKRLFRGDETMPYQTNRLTELIKTGSRVLYFAVPNYSMLQRRISGLTEQVDRPDGRTILRADASHFFFPGHRAPMERLLKETGDETELLVEPFGLIQDGYRRWIELVAELRDTHGERVSFSLDYSHLSEIQPERAKKLGPELVSTVVDELVSEFDADAISAFELNFTNAAGEKHATPDSAITQEVRLTEQTARQHGVGANKSVPRVIEARRGSLKDAREREAWGELIEAAVESARPND